MILNLNERIGCKYMNDNILYKNNDNLFSCESLYYMGGYITYEIIVFAGGFSGNCDFCIPEENVQECIKTIDTMLNLLNGEVTIKDCDSDAFLKIYFKDTMNLYVLGQLGGSYADNMLKFKMKADQTLLTGLKGSLLNYNKS